MAVTAVTKGWERCRPCIEPGVHRGRGDAPGRVEKLRRRQLHLRSLGRRPRPELGRAELSVQHHRAAPQRRAKPRRPGSAPAPAPAGACGAGCCLSRGLRASEERGGLCERRGHAATCEPPATAGGGGISGRRQEETLGGPRPPARRAHTQAHTHSHPRAHAQPAGSGDRSDANKQVGEVSRRPRPRAPVLAGKRFQNAQGEPWQLGWAKARRTPLRGTAPGGRGGPGRGARGLQS